MNGHNTFISYLQVLENFISAEGERRHELERNEKIERLIQEGHPNETDRDQMLLNMLSMGYSDGDPPSTSHLFRYNYPYILRNSFFVTIYSTHEIMLNNVCERIEKWECLNSSLKELRGKGISRARMYLVKVAGVNFPNTKEWQEIITYNKLRNCIVHRGGGIAHLHPDDFLMKYIEKNRHLSCSEGLLEIDKGFCEQVVTNIQKFEQQLQKEIHSKYGWDFFHDKHPTKVNCNMCGKVVEKLKAVWLQSNPFGEVWFCQACHDNSVVYRGDFSQSIELPDKVQLGNGDKVLLKDVCGVCGRKFVQQTYPNTRCSKYGQSYSMREDIIHKNEFLFKKFGKLL